MASDQAPFADTSAAKMLAAALKRASDERAMSLRQLAKILNYKQAVVLSHMSLGRVPIPIDRAEEIADVLDLKKETFLRAVLEQRHPDVDWSILLTGKGEAASTSGLAEELEVILGAPLSSLSLSHRRILRDIVNDPRPERRWLTTQELPIVELIRSWRPNVREDGIAEKDRQKLLQLLE
ncbi:hypothetical protein KUW15_03025 [Qipengyuania aquimaris]|uniref:hypothetical protein n=1 Tax=Qipengyuania aquimaris TaxID=255984 RepID=UPI001C9729EA|nr:hypothetical protein [Qipengyuania aquimaris]MBY6127682.1 hypothetical protein [Qipengyuania aquimaris]